MRKILQNCSPSLRDALNGAGIKTVASLMCCDADVLAKKGNIDREELQVLQKSVRLQFSSLPVCGSDFLDTITSTFCILSTGCDNWDELLDGGLYSGEITELVGAAGSGKTQACMSIASSVTLNLEKNALYIDTGGAFSSQRVQEIICEKDASLSEQDSIASLSRLRCVQAFDVFSVLDCVETTKRHINQEDDPFYQDLRLIIVDSVAAIITPILGHTMMVHLARQLKSLAVDYALSILITNNVVSDSSVAGSVKPALGQTWAHFPNTRVFLQKNLAHSMVNQAHRASKERIATVTKSSRQPLQISTTFYIGSAGIMSLPVSR
ncbi:DNA repair protein RAD51 homolog 4 isoform X2 [Nematostella vectensis]|uniref:DNA repair protein RAD51 homolog 4 isoform X2 n=1 Tax=Nematostella vectensis TaxID=45351 RepID=UPI00138FEE22|nr:DNA repair protein RAD51 homolog 4 isoform X2 [Nematostella vectensis]